MKSDSDPKKTMSNPFESLDQSSPKPIKNRYVRQPSASEREMSRAAQVAQTAVSAESKSFAKSLLKALQEQGFDLQTSAFGALSGFDRIESVQTIPEMAASWTRSAEGASAGGIQALIELGVDLMGDRMEPAQMSCAQKAAWMGNLDPIEELIGVAAPDSKGLIRHPGNPMRSVIAMALSRHDLAGGARRNESYEDRQKRIERSLALLVEKAFEQIERLESIDPVETRRMEAALAAAALIGEHRHGESPGSRAGVCKRIKRAEAWALEVEASGCAPYGLSDGNIFNVNAAAREVRSSPSMIAAAMWASWEPKEAERLTKMWPPFALSADPRSGAAAILAISQEFETNARGLDGARMAQRAASLLERCQKAGMSFGAVKLDFNHELFQQRRAIEGKLSREDKRLEKEMAASAAHPSAELIGLCLFAEAIGEQKAREQRDAPKETDRSSKSESVESLARKVFEIAAAESFKADPKGFEEAARASAGLRLSFKMSEEPIVKAWEQGLSRAAGFAKLGAAQKSIAMACVEGVAQALAEQIHPKAGSGRKLGKERALAAIQSMMESELARSEPKLKDRLEKMLMPALGKAYPEDKKIFAAVEALALSKAAKLGAKSKAPARRI